MEKIKSLKYRESTKKTCQMVWRKFNTFLLKLDFQLKSLEERTSMFGAYLFDQGIQSATLKSYFSAIKSMLVDDGYKWDDDRVILGTLTCACKMVNDSFRTRLPISKRLLEQLLFELERLLQHSLFWRHYTKHSF